MKKILLFSALFSVTVPSFAANSDVLDPIKSDPVLQGWMQGQPPAEDKVIRKQDGSFYHFPQLRWSFAHWSELQPTSVIWQGNSAPSKLTVKVDPQIKQLSFKAMDGQSSLTVEKALVNTYTDSILVMHKGNVVFEQYYGVMTPQTRHIAWSVTKSVFGLLAATLIQEGKLDPNAKVTQYIPELKGSGFADATVQQVLDMQTGVKFSENYADPKAEIWDYVQAGGLFPQPQNYQGPQGFYNYAKTVTSAQKPGSVFNYQTVNADVAGWLIRRVTNQSVSKVLSERVWQKLGVERDAYISLDSEGNEFAGGGLNLTTRDMARFGEMIRLDGQYNGQTIIPKAAIDDIKQGGDKALFAKAGYQTLPGWSYRDLWWVSHDDHGVFAARGVHGQTIYIDPKAETIIVRFASQPVAANSKSDPVLLPMYRAITNYLM